MKAIVCTGSGSTEVLKYTDKEIPSPGPDEILVKVKASSVTSGDVKLRKIPRFILIPVGIIMGFKPMEITGVEFAGEVERAGSKVREFQTGDNVFGTTTGLKFGGNAEYVCVPEKPAKGVVVKKPDNISHIEAAVIPVGSMTALHNLRKVRIEEGSKVLIYGASGSVGTYAVQLAKHFGAEVTAVCSPGSYEFVRSAGADNLIDYKKDDFTKHKILYDVIFDAVGKIKKSSCKNVLKEKGTYLSVKYPTKEKAEYMLFINELILKGKLKPFIDRTYPLEKVPDAHEYVESGRKKGNVAITID